MAKENKVRLALANNLKEELSKRRMTVADLAKALDISDSTVRSWANAEKYPRIEKIQQLADFFHITRSELISEKPDNIIPITKTVKVPLLGEIACGDPILAEENIEEYIDEPVNYLPSGKCFYLKAKGDSMKPTIPSGSKVLIRQQPTVEDDEIAAVLMLDTNEATLKRIKHSGKTMFLMPDNPDYTPIIVGKDNPVRILGKAVKYTAEL
ncbi:peptidase s24-like protein [Liquorilactobacillus ghanensis DSM 18630]|uniref:Peptidase s24-like protein n=1 Tax=Liquorilactobacillus ghanensis DSM 18630 TaxID=1423750 RepID=A0A0R1VYQ9_9LACO|nr:XRE family transcriptional regulator [Liquorilactobacillus ghanensis]KRM07004.1 peptidase s24-like protein [Liquorilactobacillus ghanensis DSM 18630]